MCKTATHRTISAKLKYNDYLLRMGVIGSPASSRNLTFTVSNEIGDKGNEVLSVNIGKSLPGSPLLKNSPTTVHSRLASPPTFYSVAGRKISIPVPTERPYHTKQGTTSGVMSKLFMKYNRQISEQRSQIDRFSNKPYAQLPVSPRTSTID